MGPDDTESEELLPEAADRAPQRLVVRWRDEVQHHPAGVLEEHAVRRSGIVPSDQAAVWVGGRGIDPGDGQGSR